jgi:AraC-like DNA-binding protein
MTDLPDRLPQRPTTVEDRGALDVLSDVLRSVRLTGAMLFLVEARTPWITQAPATRSFAAAVLPRAQHLISYHVVTEGDCWGGLAGEAPQPLEAGDILVVPHGDAYFLASPPDAAQTYGDDEAVSFFRRMAAGELPTVVNEGGVGTQCTRFICGFLGCDARPFNPVLAALPRVVHLRGAARPGRPLSHLIDFALAELAAQRPGGRDVLLRLSELMFVEVVRCHLAGMISDGPGWLAGLRDPLVARALVCLHHEPARPWTLDLLASAANTSRSTLTERFTQRVGHPPMQYLTAWRMQLAAKLLADVSTKVRVVAEAVGYDSEAAFSRAFKKHTGRSPSQWRQHWPSGQTRA